MKTYLTLPFVFVISLFTLNVAAQEINKTDSASTLTRTKVVGDDGKTLFIGSYKTGSPIREGQFQFFNKKGKLEAIGYYRNNRPCGKWIYYDKDNAVVKTLDYESTFSLLPPVYNSNESNEEIDQPRPDDGNRTVYFLVEDMPTFNNGDYNEFRKYIQQNLQFPIYCLDLGYQGKVFVRFIVDEDGKVINPTIVKSVNPDMDAEVLRVISESPRWKAGMRNGKPVAVAFTFPITFQ
ncbi:MAG TPA: TonB family protein [Williamwhitmania sp.]|nr:TonB family protein [Williamwhitmania sp.]